MMRRPILWLSGSQLIAISVGLVLQQSALQSLKIPAVQPTWCKYNTAIS